MAFTNTPNEGTPFYRGIAPEVPKPDNTAAEIISRGAATGINAFVQMALGRERAQLAQQELLQRADIEAKRLEFERDHMADAHGLAEKGLQLQEKNINLDYAASIHAADAGSELRSAQADAIRQNIDITKNGLLTAAQANMEVAKSNHKLMMEADPQLRDAENPELQVKDKVAFADLVTSLDHEWDGAPAATGIPARLAKLKTIADTQKSTIVWNGKQENMSNRQILGLLRDPETHDQAYEGLKAAGHITTEEPAFDYGHVVDSIWNKAFGKFKKDVPDPFAKKVLESAARFDPAKVERRIGPDVPRSGNDLRAQRAALYGTGGGIDSTPPPATPQNDTDQEIQRYKLAISMGKDPAAAAALFKDRTGIDASEISTEGE